MINSCSITNNKENEQQNFDQNSDKTNLVSSTHHNDGESTKSRNHLHCNTVKCNDHMNNSDSALSLRNCSSILQTSCMNHTIYKEQSPIESAKNLVRQTSTPMHHNVMQITSPDSMSCSHSVSSTSCQVSSIHSSISSESDSSPTSQSTQMK